MIAIYLLRKVCRSRQPNMLRVGVLAILLIGVQLPVDGQGFQGFRLLGMSLDTLLSTKIPRVNASYITTYYGRLHVFLVSDRQDYALRFPGYAHTLRYKPNLAWATGVGFEYKWASTEITVKLPFLGYNPTLKGNTKPFGLTLNYNNRRLWISSQYQFYRGFYIANPELLEANWWQNHAAYPYRNDLITQTISLHGLYLFNHLRLSIPASLFQREGQRKSVGSWVAGSFAMYQRIRADSSLIPLSLQHDFPTEATSRGVNTVSAGVNAGYMQTFVLGKNYFLNMSIRPGLAILLEQRIPVDAPSTTQLKLGWHGIGSLTFGYSSASYYAGVYASVALTNRAISGGFINTDTEYVRLVAGKRLRYRPKGIIKKLPGMRNG